MLSTQPDPSTMLALMDGDKEMTLPHFDILLLPWDIRDQGVWCFWAPNFLGVRGVWERGP